MNKDEIKKLLDKTDINVLDEINILEYIDELEQTKEEYIKSLDKLDVLETRIDKAIEYINDLDNCKNVYANGDMIITNDYKIELLYILRGEDNDQEDN